MERWELEKRIEKIIDKNCIEIPYEGTEVYKQNIKDEIMELIDEIKGETNNMKSFNEVINEEKNLKNKWLETPDYTIDRTLFDYKNKFYGNEHEITNEILYLMLIDIMDKLDKMEKSLRDVNISIEDLENSKNYIGDVTAEGIP
jgi:hypothetical protein